MPVIKTGVGAIELSTVDAKCVDFKGYLGNSLLKKAGVQIEWNEHSLSEYLKCKEDPVYFIENYMKVIHLDKGLVAFKLRNYQQILVHNVHNYRYNIITMARQSGKSTAVIGYVLWYILFNEYKTVMVLANKASTAREILGKAQLAYFHLPMFLQQGILEWNKGSMVLENGSRVIAEATNSDSIRGFAANMLILDECAHVENWEEFSKSVLPTVASAETSKVIQISTPKGLNHFHKTWELAQYWQTPADQLPENIQWNGYVPLLVTWKEVPGRDQKWYDETIRGMNFDYDKFAQEYECQFLGSSGTLIAGWKLKELQAKIPIYNKDGIYKYIDKEPDHTYILTVDVSEGRGMNYSTFHVTDITEMPYKQACVYRSNLVEPFVFAQIIHQMASYYNKAYVLVEFEKLGPQISDVLFNDLSYDHMLYSESAGTRGKKISQRAGKNVDRGIKMSLTVKQVGCSFLKLLIEQNQYIISDHHTIEELARFSRKGKVYQAEEGFNDDLVMALVVFAWLSNDDFFKNLTDINTLSKLREKTDEEIFQELIPFGIVQSEIIIDFSRQPLNPDAMLHWAFQNCQTLNNF